MTDHQVVCADHGTTNSLYTRIVRLNAGGRYWTPEEMAQHIILKWNRFYTIDPASGLRAEVEAHRTSGGRWYVATKPDPVTGNNLESLSACPRYPF